MRAILDRSRRPTAGGPVGAVLLVVALTVATGAFSQEPNERFEESIDVQIIDLDVVVTDAAGRRVPGLSRHSFRLRVDGEPVPIAYFSEVGSAVAGGATTPSTDVPVNFLVFVDDYVTLKRNRDFTLARLRGELPELGPRDRMAVVAYDGRRLRILSAWSGSPEVLDDALSEAMSRPARGVKWVALARMPGYIANWIGNATRRSVLAATSSLRLLPQPQGRRVMLLVAGSWDPWELERAGSFSPWCVSGPCDGVFVYTALTDTANELGYSIYAVDVEGRDVQGDWNREMRLQDTLGQLARQTGGKALLNTDRRRMLSIASAESRSYYSIGFEPVGSEPDSRHWIEVEVLEPGLEVRTQRSFVTVSERRHRDLETLAALLIDTEVGGDSFPVEAGPMESLRRGRMRIPVSVFVPLDELTWIASRGSYQALFEVGLATLDKYGHSQHETWEVRREELSIPRAGELEHLEFELERRRRRQTLAVTIKDLNGERELTTVVPIEPDDEERDENTAADESRASEPPNGAPAAMR